MNTVDIIDLLPLPDMVRYTKPIVFFIVLMGIALPFLSSTIAINLTTARELISTLLFFIFMSFCVWVGVVWLVTRLRHRFSIAHRPLIKIGALSAATALYTFCVIALLMNIWLAFNYQHIDSNIVLRTALTGSGLVVMLTLVYEIVLLTKERVLDTKIVDQLDLQRSKAEMTALKNELDPHFMFNSLTTLSHLIHADADKAYLFNNKLAQVYKYFLLNKDRELISLDNELEFIENYFFLLRIRHDEKLKLTIRMNDDPAPGGMILPCALQVLAENAIKHNEFSDKNPLEIQIIIDQDYIKVTNNVRPKPYPVDSTRIGLKNLSYRYKLTSNREIKVEKLDQHFHVQLPIIKVQKV